MKANDSRGGDLGHFLWRGITRFGLPLQAIGWLILTLRHVPRDMPETRSPGLLATLLFSILVFGILSGALYGFVMWWVSSRTREP